MTLIDQSTWNRKELFDFFSTISNPFYMVTFTVDVTPVYGYAKTHNLSFYYALIYLCTQAMNSVDAFRYAIRGEDVYFLEQRDPSFTDLKKDSELFHIVTMPCESSIDVFCRAAAQTSQAQNCFVNLEAETDELIYFSCLPWVELTALTNERDLSAPTAKDDSIPRLAWGRYTETDGRKKLNLSMEVNHRLIDGKHIGLFYEALSQLIEALH